MSAEQLSSLPSVMSTTDVPRRDAFAYWQDLICATFVRLTAQPRGEGPFHGQIEHVSCGVVGLSRVTAVSQTVRRTRSLIARDDEEFLLASVLLEGRGRVEQDGRVAELSAGAMAFYDSARPYSLQSDEPSCQLVVQVPKRALHVGDTRHLTARTLGAGTPGVVVSDFLRSLFGAALEDVPATSMLVQHAVGLLSTAAVFAGDGAAVIDTDHVTTLEQQRIFDFLRRHFADPRLDADAVADACNVSRRSLYRIIGEGGVAGHLRRLRLEHAELLLLRYPRRSVSAIRVECGFDSDSGFHRAFRGATGLTPGGYRRVRRSGPPVDRHGASRT